jgi:anti-sigma regulatory factor (Ser/Thr protein kinase)
MHKEGKEPLDQVEIHIRANPAYLSVARSAVRKATEIAGLSVEEADEVTLALDEALTNVIRHSYGGPCAELIIVKLSRIASKEGQRTALEIIVRDFGKQVDPATIKSRDLEDVRPGGLGVHIIQSVMDEVEYSCQQEGGMQLRMTKYIDASENSDTTSDLKAGYSPNRHEKTGR